MPDVNKLKGVRKMSKQNYEENNFETVLEGLIGFMKSMPRSQVKMLNPSRYKLMLRTAAQLTDLLRKTVSDGELEIDVDTTFNQGSITVELDLLSIDEPLAFADVIYKADNFEIYPLTNGKIRLDVTFQSVLKTIK